MHILKLESDITLEQLYNLLSQLPAEEKIQLADHLRAQAAQEQWEALSEELPDVPDISMEEIVAEVKEVRKTLKQRW